MQAIIASVQCSNSNAVSTRILTNCAQGMLLFGARHAQSILLFGSQAGPEYITIWKTGRSRGKIFPKIIYFIFLSAEVSVNDFATCFYKSRLNPALKVVIGF